MLLYVPGGQKKHGSASRRSAVFSYLFIYSHNTILLCAFCCFLFMFYTVFLALGVPGV